jgi:acyl-CoA reductase-like NAD-dependent aldehyde dehydrogenase
MTYQSVNSTDGKFFKTALDTLKFGDPLDETTTHGPLSTEAAQVDAAVKGGAKLLLGDRRVASRVDTGKAFINRKLVRTGHITAPV